MRIKFVGVLLLMCLAVSAQAQNKVVVIPLGGDDAKAAGSDKQVQFNNSGEIGGAANLYYDSVNGFTGIGTSTPSSDFHINQSDAATAGTGGMTFQFVSDEWKIFHSGIHLSFVETVGVNAAVRRAYVEGGTGNYVQPSSRNLKSNIHLINQSLNKVLQLKPVSYNYKGVSTDKRTYGFIAEEVAELFPELVRYDEKGEPGIAYSGFGPLAIGAIKQQQLQLDQLKQENQALKTRLDRLEMMLN